VSRFAVVARLKPDTSAQAIALVERGPPFDPGAVGLERHEVYVSHGEAVFVFEGEEVESIVGDLVDDPFRSPVFEQWEPIIDGSPRVASAAYVWSRVGADRER
jgi:hypothetical protein